MNSKIDEMLMPWIGKIGKVGTFYLAEAFKYNGVNLTKEQFLLLMFLFEKDGLPQNDLAFITNRNKTSLARLITGLEKKELVRRTASEADKRCNLVYLTASGKKLFETAFPIGEEAMKCAQDGISEEEVAITISVLKKVLENMEKGKDHYRCNKR